MIKLTGENELLDTFKTILEYNKNNGTFTWKTKLREHFNSDTGMKIANSRCEGKLAGTIEKPSGYHCVRLLGKQYKIYRLVWLFEHGNWPDKDIDHIDGNKNNNHISNLREASHAENMQNIIKAQKNNKTGFLGVTKCKITGSYISQIGINGKTKRIGCFKTPEDAHEAYVNEKRLLHQFGTL